MISLNRRKLALWLGAAAGDGYGALVGLAVLYAGGCTPIAGLALRLRGTNDEEAVTAVSRGQGQGSQGASIAGCARASRWGRFS